MLDLQIRIEGDRVLIEGLNKLSQEFPRAVQRGMERSAKGIHRAAYMFLKGPAAHYEPSKAGKLAGRQAGKRGKKIVDTAAGGYPVPVRTGHLWRMLDWLKPGQSKTGPAGTFSAGPNEVVIYDSAIYANVIHEGKWTSKAHGPRRYLTDALEMFNRGLGIQMAIEDEIQKAKAKAGLK